MKRILLTALILVLIVSLAGCGGTRQKRGTVIGAGAGAALGALLGNKAGNTALGAVIGAAVGGAAGAHIGHYMDEQAAEMEKELEGARVERVGEGIVVTFDSGLLFAVNQSTLQPEARANLDRMAVILKKYDDTNIMIGGHTDSSGSDSYNQTLSVSRAESVSSTLTGLDIARSRMTVQGFGESQPIATNDTEEGRALNRRVEIAIYANEELKKVAEKKAG